MAFQFGMDNNKISGITLSSYYLEKGDIKFLKEKNEDVFDFVGFALTDKNILTVFPKHFYNDSELSLLNGNPQLAKDDIKLLFNVFIKYTLSENTSAKASKYYGYQPEFISDYPFAPFFEVYKYYRKFGIYREDDAEIKPNSNGDISWKTTIQKSQVIISDGSLLFAPLYKKKKKRQNVFLTECMAFVINHTINSFPLFISLPQIDYRLGAFDFLKNSTYTIVQLNQIKSKTFKDAHKKLITQLIRFFEQYNKRPKGGAIHIKINYFDKIWEKMVQKYLNDNFVDFDDATNKIIYNESIASSSVHFEPTEFSVDKSTNGFKIRLDHFAENDEAVYIFDSKYYSSIRDLNYKQFAYNEMLRGYIKESKIIHSALILPDVEERSGCHFEFADNFVGSRKTGVKIVEQYLSVKRVMKNYIL